MFGKEKIRPPDTEFIHGHDCKILRADPSTSIPWSEMERGLWERRCVQLRVLAASQPLAASGSIRSIRRPHATWERASKRASLNPT